MLPRLCSASVLQLGRLTSIVRLPFSGFPFHRLLRSKGSLHRVRFPSSFHRLPGKANFALVEPR